MPETQQMEKPPRRRRISAASSLEKMEGTWDLRATIRDCQTGAPIGAARSLNTFGGGRSLIEICASASLRGPGHGQGTWRHLEGANYEAVSKFFRLNADGAFAGVQRLTRYIELSEDANEFTATTLIEVFDADDSLIQTVCATERGSRF